MPQRFIKDPNAQLDYKFDWSNWLETSEVISSYTLVVQTGLVEETSSNDDDSVTVWLSGGVAGNLYTVLCRVETDSYPVRIDDRTITIYCMER